MRFQEIFKVIPVFILFSIFSVSLLSQEYIYFENGGNATATCGDYDTLLWSTSGISYPAGTNMVITICPSNTTESTTQLNFLSGVGLFNIPDGDNMILYDGDDTTAPVLGTFNSSNSPNGFVIQTTLANVTACLTIELVSAASSPGGSFWGLVNCGSPWQPFSFGIETTPAQVDDTLRVCHPQEIELNANTMFQWQPGDPGYPQTDANCNFIWNMGDGTTYSGFGLTNVTHSYGGAFGFYCVLTVVDSLGQYVRDSLVVMHSAAPIFAGVDPLDSVICFGEQTQIVGSIFNTDNIGFEFPTVPFFTGGLFGEQEALPDSDNCAGYSTSIDITGYPASAVIDDPFDFVEVCVTIEHSFLGDLECFLEAPNGSQVILWNSYNGNTSCADILPGGFAGGGTYLGDADDGAITPGIGWTYCFSPLAPLGTLGDEWAAGYVSPTTISGGNAVTPGTFLPENPISDIYGTDVNGSWTLNVYDMWGADNGYIFDWSIQFGPDINPEADTYMQTAIDATWDDGGSSNIIAQIDSGIVVEPTAPGLNEFVFTVSDDFGCSHDTIITVNTIPIPEIQAFDDLLIDCESSIELGVDIVGIPPPPDNCFWTLDLYDNGFDGWEGGTLEVFVDGVSVGVYTVPIFDWFESFSIPVNNTGVIDLVYTPGGFPNENEIFLIAANGDTIFVQENGTPPTGTLFAGATNCTQPLPTNYSFVWSPDNDVVDPTAQYTQATNITELTTFTVEVYEDQYSQCAAIDSMQAIPPAGALTAGEDIPGCVMSYQLSGFSIDNMGEWTAPAGSGITFSDPFDPNATVFATTAGIYPITWNDITGQNCPSSDDIMVTFLDSIQISLNIDSTSCFGYCDGEVVAGATGGTAVYGHHYEWSNGIEGIGENAIEGLCAGPNWLKVTDDNGCEFIKSFEVPEPPSLTVDSINIERESCLNACDGTVSIYSTTAQQFSYDGGFNYVGSNVGNTLCGGTQTIYLANGDGCIIERDVFIPSPIPPEANFTVEPEFGTVYNPILQFYNESSGNVADLWQFSYLGQYLGESDENAPQFEFPSEVGTYDITLVVTDTLGCEDSLRKSIEIKDEILVYIPNAFTPNGDGINDVMTAYGSDIDPENFSFKLFDRFGSQVYETNEFPFYWDGSVNGGSYYAENGVYVWYLVAKSLSTTEKHEAVGHITLIR